MTPLDKKIIDAFPGLVVRKDLTKSVKGNAVVPSYVLEYLLGQYCATDDEETIENGVIRVRDILEKHYVHRSQAELVRSNIRERGRYKIIDRVTIELNDKDDYYEARFSNLGLKKVPTKSEYVKKHPKLLVGGIWCIIDMSYEASDDPKACPWHIDTLKPIQVAHCDLNDYVKAREAFTSEEWMGMLLQTMGFNPEMFNRRSMLLQLIRLVAFCERNYNLMELGPKGTGKSHIFSEFSPHGILISGGEITMAKLFVNNASGKIGLVGYWDTICFDEFAGKDKKVDKSLVDIMKNYMANKSFSRGIESLGAEASMVFMGNTKKSVAYMLKHSHFFEPLPDKYIDSAFLDRIHAFNPGWEVSPISNDLFTGGYGLIVDYLAEILRELRVKDFAHFYEGNFKLSSDITTRDRDGIHKTFAGLMKLIHPSGECSKEEMQELLSFAVESRKRVKDQILRIDETFDIKDFYFEECDTHNRIQIQTLEEQQYPQLAYTERPPEQNRSQDETSSEEPSTSPATSAEEQPQSKQDELISGEHLIVPENVKGYSYERLFARHLKGATRIVIRDPYIRMFHQARNLIELLGLVNDLTPGGDETHVHLVTQSDREEAEKQDGYLRELETSTENSKVNFTYAYDSSPTFHARSIQTNTGWKISLDRGLDIYQRYESGMLSLATLSQNERLSKGCEITYLKQDLEE